MITLVVNGATHSLDLPDDVPLLWVLREELGLTGTKFGCGVALCGACTVHLDGSPVRSCVTPVGEAAGKHVLTIEGLGARKLHVIQEAWIAENVPQCGYCQPGQIMSALGLLRTRPAPTDEDIDAVLSANLCRCGTYPRIRKAVQRAAAAIAREGGGEPTAPASRVDGGLSANPVHQADTRGEVNPVNPVNPVNSVGAQDKAERPDGGGT